MSTRPRSATLAERRAEADALRDRIKEHGHQDMPAPKCQCEEMREMRRELADLREEIRTWFDPPPGTRTLFDE